MSEHSAERGGSAGEVKFSGEDLIDLTEASIDLSDRVTSLADEEFGHSPRVIHERIGDAITNTLAFSQDLDVGLFVDELRDFDGLIVKHEYVMSNKPGERDGQVTFNLTRGMDCQVVTFVNGQEPVIEEYTVAEVLPKVDADIDASRPPESADDTKTENQSKEFVPKQYVEKNYRTVEPTFDWLATMNNVARAVESAIGEEAEIVRDKREF